MRASWGVGTAARGFGRGRSRQGDAELELGQPPRPPRRRLGRDVVGVQRRVQAQPVERGDQAPGHVLGVRAAPAVLAIAVGQHAGEHGAPAALELLERAAQLLGVHRLAPRVDPHPPHVAVGPGLEVEVGGQARGRIGVAARDRLQLVEVRAGGGREGLGDDVVARVEVVVEQPQAGARLAGDRPDRRLGEAAALDDAPGRVDQLGAAAVGPADPRDARRGLGPAHPVGTCSGVATGAAGTASSAASTRRWRGGRCTDTGSPCSCSSCSSSLETSALTSVPLARRTRTSW